KMESIKNLSSVALTELGGQSAVGNGKKYTLAENVQVYLRSGSDYALTNAKAVTEGYSLTGYYDNGGAAGGRIRVLVATKKGN
ncbi:MAG: S-layer homology domain-containing protein, partial [Ruthenibacterium sp.]